MVKFSFPKIGTTLIALVASVWVAQAQSISTSYDVDLTYFGAPNSETYGQTFTALNTQLDDFSLWLDNWGPSDQAFQLYIGVWTGSDVGAILFEQDFASSNPGAGNTEYTVTPNIAVTNGAEYIAFVSTSNEGQTSSYSMSAEGSFDTPAGSEFVFLNNGTDTTQWSSGSWSDYYVPNMTFNADFSKQVVNNPTPSPAAGIPMLIGGIAAFARRRKSRA